MKNCKMNRIFARKNYLPNHRFSKDDKVLTATTSVLSFRKYDFPESILLMLRRKFDRNKLVYIFYFEKALRIILLIEKIFY